MLSDPKNRELYDIFLGTGLLVPFELWKKEHETHGAVHWKGMDLITSIGQCSHNATGNLSPTPQISDAVGKSEDTHEKPSSSGKTLLQQFRDYDL